MMELTTRIGTAKGTFRDKRGPAPACPSRSRARPARCRPRPTGAASATAGSSAMRPPSAPRSRSPSCWETTPNWRIKATYVGRHIVGEYARDARRAARPRLLAARAIRARADGAADEVARPSVRRACGPSPVGRIDCPAPRRASNSAACSFTNGSRASRRIAAAARRSSTATTTCRGAACCTGSIGARRSSSDGHRRARGSG